MKRRSGYTLVELVLVLLLLVLVASAVFILAASGSQAFLRLSSRQSASADLRTGLSYIDVQVHKHDARDALSIRPDPFGGSPALVISQTIGGEPFLTWIYVRDGYLRELFIEEGTAINPDMDSQIVRMDELQLSQVSADTLQVVLIRKDGSEGPAGESPAEQKGSRQIHLRAGGVSP
jgi:hypothetical protein